MFFVICAVTLESWRSRGRQQAWAKSISVERFGREAWLGGFFSLLEKDRSKWR